MLNWVTPNGMQKNSFKSRIVRWWFGGPFCFVQMEKILNYRPKKLRLFLRDRLRTWVIHPLKRRIAKYYLLFLRKTTGLKVIGITGSCGKTTTKDLLAAILKTNKLTVASFANIDPLYNIPTTILRCGPKTRYLVLEMGVEYPGEMDFYLWLAIPDVGIITNINPTHTLYFKGTEGVFAEKSKLVKALSSKGFAVLNKNDKYLKKLTNKLTASIVWFDATQVAPSINKTYLLNFEDVACAKAAAKIWGISNTHIESGIKCFTPPEHRLKIIHHKSGAVIVDDSYNNNPKAAGFALKSFVALAGKNKKVVVFGDMLELGALETKEHEKIGLLIKSLHVNTLICVGKASETVGQYAGVSDTSYFSSWQEAEKKFKSFLKPGNYLLVKGSRSIGLDNLVSGVVY